MPRHLCHVKMLTLLVALSGAVQRPCAAQTPADSAIWARLALGRLLQKVPTRAAYRRVTIETADSSASQPWSVSLAGQLRSALLATPLGPDTTASIEVTLLPLKPLLRGDRPGAQWEVVISLCDAIPPHGSGGAFSTSYAAEIVHADSTWHLYLSSIGRGDGLCAYPPANH